MKLESIDLDDPIRPATNDKPIVLAVAKNEWTSFAVQLSDLPAAGPGVRYVVRVSEPQMASGKATISTNAFSAAQILPMPVDVNRAGYVRETGRWITNQPLPRALLPEALKDGELDLEALRDPGRPLDASGHYQGGTAAVRLWFDLHVPAQTNAGNYQGAVELVEGDRVIASIPLQITVYDFALPDERNLVMVSRLRWADLKRLYPDEFETVSPRLLSRRDERCAGAIRVLDAIEKLAHENRTEVVIGRLQPIVKWELDKTLVEWDELDTVLAPWMSGKIFSDRVPMSYWPVPAVDYLDEIARHSQLSYWSQAAAHFEQKAWLGRSSIWIDPISADVSSSAEAMELSAQAAQILALNPRVRVTLPLHDDQIELASSPGDKLIRPKDAKRLMSAGLGIVFASPSKPWPKGVARPEHWLRTDRPGLVPYVGAGGDERDARVWSYLAFLRNASMILWGSPVSRENSPTEAADPNDLIWFYPGRWFGVSDPVPTIQLKWLRRAEQEYEYLNLARQRGEVINATLMARLLTKPVEIQPGQRPDPTYALLCGTSDFGAWNEAEHLLADTILLRTPGRPVDRAKRDELGIHLLRWCGKQESPVLMNRTARWEIDRSAEQGSGAASAAHRLDLDVGIDIYNASDVKPAKNLLQWTALPRGWEAKPQPMQIPSLSTYHVQRFNMAARYNLTLINSRDHQPAEVTFTNGYNGQETKMQFVLPVATSERLPPGLKLDGRLDDWNEADAIQAGPMVRMFNRPALHREELQYAQHDAEIFTGWADENFYVAFKLKGVSTGPITQSQNFVNYQFRRAWGNDLSEILIQPIFADNTVGPVLHVVCKPTSLWVERKIESRGRTATWEPFETAGGVRYAARRDDGTWRGEVAIPWKAIVGQHKGLPTLLRFNFSQHTQATGESASWAGPIDFGRDDGFMGLLYLTQPHEPGMGRRASAHDRMR